MVSGTYVGRVGARNRAKRLRDATGVLPHRGCSRLSCSLRTRACLLAEPEARSNGSRLALVLASH
eukprot:6839145-Prymnesium_polylepis.1